MELGYITKKMYEIICLYILNEQYCQLFNYFNTYTYKYCWITINLVEQKLLKGTKIVFYNFDDLFNTYLFLLKILSKYISDMTTETKDLVVIEVKGINAICDSCGDDLFKNIIQHTNTYNY